MNEKNYKRIIIILSIICAISIGIGVYFAWPTSTETKLNGVIEAQRNTIIGLQSDLSGAKSAVTDADRNADELKLGIRGALDIVERSAERIDGITDSTLTAVQRQLRINELVVYIIEDNRRLKEQLRDSLGENQ
jgi:hypothetical protein